MKFYIISSLWHSLIILSLFVFVKSPVPIIPRMDIKDEISINFTMAYSPKNKQPFIEKKKEVKNPIIPKKQKEEKKIIEEKKVAEIIEEKVELVEVLELKDELEIVDDIELIEEKVETEIIEVKEELIELEVIEEIEKIETEIETIDKVEEIKKEIELEEKIKERELLEEKVEEIDKSKEINYNKIVDNEIEKSKDYNIEKSNKEQLNNENFILKDNSYIAKNQDVQGLSYSFIRTPEPRYPNMARRAGIKDEVLIKVRFLVNEKGRVEEIIFYDNVTSYGFRQEVTRALNNWQLSPVTIGDKVVKMYFYKVFRFNVK